MEKSVTTNLKFTRGEDAREKWSKPITTENSLTIQEYNKIINPDDADNALKFEKAADIKLDEAVSRQTTIKAVSIEEMFEDWCNGKHESLYAFIRNGHQILKIGGTRKTMKERFGSYLCGFHVPQRGKSGKMSVTNAHIVHTIEKDLLDNPDNTWELYVMRLPVIIHKNDFMGLLEGPVQIYHLYESRCIQRYKEITGEQPMLNFNSDPAFQKSIKKMSVKELINECESLELNPYTEETYKSGKKKGTLKSKKKEELIKLILDK